MSELCPHGQLHRANCSKCYPPRALEARIAELEAAIEMKDKRIDWTVTDNARKAMRIEDLEAELATAREKQKAAQDENERLAGSINGPHGWKALVETLKTENKSLIRGILSAK